MSATWTAVSPRQFVASQIAAAHLKPRERKLALWLLEHSDIDGFVIASHRDLYLQLTGETPAANGFVQVNSDVVLKALKSLCKASVLAFTWNWPIGVDVSMAFMEYPKGGLQTWDG